MVNGKVQKKEAESYYYNACPERLTITSISLDGL
jgi:hypothetical protein